MALLADYLADEIFTFSPVIFLFFCYVRFNLAKSGLSSNSKS